MTREEIHETYKNLLVAIAGTDCAGILQQSVAQSTLSMVDVGDDAKVAVALDGDVVDALLEL
jgi:hypothetical protein